MATEYNRQYIGARYVPQFFKNPDGSWDWMQGFQYEPLTIVKYGENTYTSKSLVPANVGSPNLNPEYWANTGNYNGAIVDLNNKINNIQQTLNKRYIPQGNKYFLMADSYGLNQNGITGWITQALNMLNALNIPAEGEAHGGSGFNTPDYGSWYNYITSLNLNGYTHFILLAGTNDRIDDNLSTEMQKCAEYLQSKNIKFIYGFIGHNAVSWDRLTNIAQKRSMEKELCIQYGIEWIEHAPYWIYSKTLLSDDLIHPITAGNLEVANGIVDYILGTDYQKEVTISNNGATLIRQGSTAEIVIQKNVSGISGILQNTYYPLYAFNELPDWMFYAQNLQLSGIMTLNKAGVYESHSVLITFGNAGLRFITTTPINGANVTDVYLEIQGHFNMNFLV